MPGETMPRSKLDLLFCELSPGGIYGAFSEFYFDYITVDWTEILLEIYFDPTDMPDDIKSRLADAIRKDNAGKDALSSLADEDVIIWKQEEVERREEQEEERSQRGDSALGGYQTGRMGKNFIKELCKK